MSRFSVFLDTCVVVPIDAADLLMRLAVEDCYRPLWSQAVLDELRRTVLKVHPGIGDAKIERRIDQMNATFEDALVTGWEALVPGIELPDPDDRHIVAAAVRGRADLIVTENLRDFPDETLLLWDLEAQSLDGFLLDQLDLAPDAVMNVLCQQAQARSRPPVSVEELLDQFERIGIPGFVKAVNGRLWRMPG